MCEASFWRERGEDEQLSEVFVPWVRQIAGGELDVRVCREDEDESLTFVLFVGRLWCCEFELGLMCVLILVWWMLCAGSASRMAWTWVAW